MNATARKRLKWEVAFGGILVLSAALYCRGLWQSFEEPFSDRTFSSKKADEANKRQEASIPRGTFSYPYYKWEPRPLIGIKYELNSLLKWKEGQIGLRAIDYRDDSHHSEIKPSEAGKMTVLLINDTNNVLEVPSQDGDIYLMLQVKLHGKWTRAQHHSDSWCGNSYGTRPLPAHTYVQVFGHQPTTGRFATARFVIKNGAEDALTSPEFDGIYSADDIALSAFDSLAFREASLQELKAFLLRQITPPLLPANASISDLRRSAWESLLSGRHDPSAALKIAKETVAQDQSFESSFKDVTEGHLRERQTYVKNTTSNDYYVHGFKIIKSQSEE
jgi:hypothetical protein